jgi:hypothetical protein
VLGPSQLAPGLSLTGIRLIIPDHASGFPVLRALSLCTCCRHYPGAADGHTRRSKIAHPYQPSPIPLSGRPAHRPFRGLLSVYSRCGLHTRAVTNFVTAIRGLQTFRLLHACPGCFRLERSPGGACTRWKSGALSRRTWIAVIRWSVHQGRGRAESGRTRRVRRPSKYALGDLR